MTGVTDMGREELRSRLLAFDRAVALLHPGHSFRLVLVGGGAMVLSAASHARRPIWTCLPSRPSWRR